MARLAALTLLVTLATESTGAGGSFTGFRHVVDNVAQHFRAHCMVVYISPGHGSLIEDEQEVTSWLKHSSISSTIVRLGRQQFDRGQAVTADCNLPLYVLPGLYDPSYLNPSLLSSVLKGHGMTSTVWLQFLDPDVSLEEWFEGVDIPFDCEFLVAQRVQQGRVNLTEVYRVRGGLPLQSFHFGSWTPGHGLDVTQLNFHQRRHDLQGIVLKSIVASEALAFVDTTESPPKVGGYSGKILELLMQKLNFTANFTVVQDEKWGDIYPNGSMDGMISTVMTKAVDFSTNGFYFTSRRLTLLDYSAPIILVRCRMFIRKPDNNMKWNHFIKPFSLNLWSTHLMAVLVILAYAAAVQMVDRRWLQERRTQSHVDETFFSLLSIFLQQGYSSSPRAAPLRVIFVTSLLTSWVVMQAYSGVLISFLAVNRVELPFDDVKGLLADTSYEVGFQALPNSKSSDHVARGSSDLDLLQDRIHAVQDPPSTVLEGLNRVCLSKFALLIPIHEASRHQGAVPCELVAVPFISHKGCLAFAMVKHSPYRTAFNYLLHKMDSAGILKKFRKESFSQKWTKEKTIDVNSVNLQCVAPLLVTLLTGFVLSLVMFLAEHLVFSINSRLPFVH